MKAVVNKVTEKDFGKAVVTAAAVDEVEVAWGTEPAATTTTDSITLSGSTSVGGYVYCMVSKTGVSQAPATPTVRILEEKKEESKTSTDDKKEEVKEEKKEEPKAPASSADPYLSMLTN
jgi:hypothetical protein